MVNNKRPNWRGGIVFGYVMASIQELTQEERSRYRSVYCGICRRIGKNCSQCSRMALTYDMVFLALLLSSLYEPEETSGASRCLPHPIRRQPWTDSDVLSYAADMNVALAFYSADDHWRDDRRLDALALRGLLKKHCPAIYNRWPRQCAAIESCIEELSRLEAASCPNPDLPANGFGCLMAELMVLQEDFWAPTLRRLGMSLGRFIYLADGAIDFEKDRRRGSYNPFLALGTGSDFDRWTRYLTLEMAACTEAFEQLPLVQDKSILDNILYSGIWLTYRQKEKKVRHDR